MYRTLLDLLYSNVAKNPNKIAIKTNDEIITYQQLWDKSTRVSNYLTQCFSLNKDECFVIMMDNSPDVIICIWGIIMAGGVYAPINTDYPEERIKYILEDLGAKVIISQKVIKDKLDEIVPNSISILDVNDILNYEANPNHHINSVLEDSLAYIIYTSGSTGYPKGVMIEHKSIVNQMMWLQQEFKFDAETVLIQKTPIGFDAAQWELLSSVFGSQLIIGDKDIHKNPEILIERVIEYKVSVLQCVPLLLQALVSLDRFRDCSSLKKVFVGGEALSSKLAIKFYNTLDGCELINLYGPTEATINSSYYIVDRNDLSEDKKNVSIGYNGRLNSYH